MLNRILARRIFVAKGEFVVGREGASGQVTDLRVDSGIGLAHASTFFLSTHVHFVFLKANSVLVYSRNHRCTVTNTRGFKRKANANYDVGHWGREKGKEEIRIRQAAMRSRLKWGNKSNKKTGIETACTPSKTQAHCFHHLQCPLTWLG